MERARATQASGNGRLTHTGQRPLGPQGASVDPSAGLPVHQTRTRRPEQRRSSDRFIHYRVQQAYPVQLIRGVARSEYMGAGGRRPARRRKRPVPSRGAPSARRRPRVDGPLQNGADRTPWQAAHELRAAARRGKLEAIFRDASPEPRRGSRAGYGRSSNTLGPQFSPTIALHSRSTARAVRPPV